MRRRLRGPRRRLAHHEMAGYSDADPIAMKALR
jgi:hypothetical protein